MAESKSSTKRALLWFFGGAFLLGLLCCGGVAIFIAPKAMQIAKLSPEERPQAFMDAVGIDTSAENDLTEGFFVALREDRLDDAYAMTSPNFRRWTGREEFERIDRKIDRVMGDYGTKRLSDFNKTIRNGSSTTHLNYTADFADGEGTISMTLVELPDGTLAIESFKVDSPRFNAQPAEEPADEGR